MYLVESVDGWLVVSSEEEARQLRRYTFSRVEGPFATSQAAWARSEELDAARLPPAVRACPGRLRWRETGNAGTLWEPILKTPHCPACGVRFVPGVGKFWKHP